MELDEQQIEDLLVGAKILGTGGGGEIEWARPMARSVFDRGKKFVIIDPLEVPDDELVVIVGKVGGGVSKEVLEMIKDYRSIYRDPELVAFKNLSRSLGKEFYAVLPPEIGAGNMISAMYVAAMHDKVTVDADICGRAKPEISISTTNIAGVPITPLCLVTPLGDMIYIESVVDDTRAEHLCRALANASGGIAGLCRCPMKGKDMRRVIIANSITKCIYIGKAIREASSKGRDPVEALIKAINGIEMFRGNVHFFSREERGAFVWGEILITGSNVYERRTLRVFFKNENLISWLDNQPYVTCPDAICIVDARTAFGLSNWGYDFTKGREVVVIGVRADPIWRSGRGLQLFGPSRFGFNIPYVPLEEVMTRFERTIKRSKAS